MQPNLRGILGMVAVSLLATLIAAPSATLLATTDAATEEPDAVLSVLIGDDQYLSGGSVTIEKHPGAGDILAAGGVVVLNVAAPAAVFLAGGEVRVLQPIAGDALLAGGSVEVQAPVGDDVRAAGGSVIIAAPVGSDLVAAGGEVLLQPGAKIGGEAALAGGSVTVLGSVAKRLQVNGGVVVLNGTLHGPVEATAHERLEIGPDARIAGDLVYHSPQPAQVDPAAVLSGAVTHLLLEEGEEGLASSGPGIVGALMTAVLGMIGFGLLAVALLAAFPAFTRTASQAIAGRAWQSLLLGLAIFFTLPATATVLLVTLIGAPLGLVLLLLVYPLALLAGWLLFALRLGEWALSIIGPVERAPMKWRVLFAFLGVLVLFLLATIPYLGGLVCLIGTALGMGALGFEGWRIYRGAGPQRRAGSYAA